MEGVHVSCFQVSVNISLSLSFVFVLQSFTVAGQYTLSFPCCFESLDKIVS